MLGAPESGDGLGAWVPQTGLRGATHGGCDAARHRSRGLPPSLWTGHDAGDTGTT